MQAQPVACGFFIVQVLLYTLLETWRNVLHTSFMKTGL